jgi:polyferredoxin
MRPEDKKPSTHRVRDPWPRLFRSGASARYRRLRLAFLVVYFGLASLLLWPIYPAMGGARPMILGLPLSFAWVIGVLLAMFALLLVLFRAEEGGR